MKRFLIMLLGISLVFAGCGERGGSDAVITVEDPEEYNPVDLVLAAVKQTGAAPSYRADFELKLTGMPFLGEIVQPMSYEQAANGDYSIVADLSDFSADGESFSEFGEFVLEMRQVGNVLYVSLPWETLGQIADTPWVSVAEEQLTEEELEEFQTFDPSEQLNFLLAVDEDATISLGERVNGIAATRISGESTFENLLDSLDVEERQEMLDSIVADLVEQDVNDEEVISSLEKLYFGFDVWIGEDGYILREIIVMDNWYDFLAAIDPEVRELKEIFEDFGMIFETHYFDYGASITIDVPPPEDVTPFDGSLDDLLA